MNDLDREQQLFEAELGRMRPAPAPEELKRRLLVQARSSMGASGPVALSGTRVLWSQLRRWFIPAFATASVALLALVFFKGHQTERSQARNATQPVVTSQVPHENQASQGQIEFDRRLLSAFDTIAELPDGLPVRFQCRQWEDKVTFHDPQSGVWIERSRPRLEIVPVSFETY